MNLLILGAGGFGCEVYEMAAESGVFRLIAFLDDNSDDERCIGKTADYPRFVGEFQCAIPAIGNNPLRLKWVNDLKAAGYRVPTLIHPTAYVSPSARIREGTVVQPHANVMTGAKIGEGCIINVGSIVDHDATIEPGCHVCLNAVVKAGAILPACTKLEAGEILRSPWEK